MSSSRLVKVRNWLKKHGSKTGVVVRRGRLVGEWYFDDATPQSRYLVYSTTKSFSSTAAGLAIAAGKMKLETKVGELLPDVRPEGKRDVTVRQLLSMTSGVHNDPGISAKPDLFGYTIDERYIEAFQGAIDNYYEIADGMVGEMLKRVPENTRVIVISDHGMHADFLDGKDKGKKTFLSAHHLDAPPGVLIAAGEGIQKGPGLAASLEKEALQEMGTVFDVAPTVLYLLDIPVGRNMKLGRVMKSVVDESLLASRPVEHIDSHDVDFRPPTSSRSSHKGDKAFREKFAALGYIDSDGGENTSEFKLGPGRK